MIRRARVCIMLIFIMIIASSCAKTSHLKISNAKSYSIKNLSKKLLILKPNAQVLEIGVLSNPDPIEKFTKTATLNYTNNLESILKKRNIKYSKSVSYDSHSEFEELVGSLVSVNKNVRRFVLGHANLRLPNLKKHIDYEIGSIEKFLLKNDADYLLFGYAVNYKETSGRKTVKVVGAIVGALFGFNTTISSPISYIALCLVNKEGKIIWIGANQPEGADFTSSFEVKKSLEKIVNDSKLF